MKKYLLVHVKGEFGWKRSTDSHLYEDIYLIVDSLGKFYYSHLDKEKQLVNFLASTARGVGKKVAQDLVNKLESQPSQDLGSTHVKSQKSLVVELEFDESVLVAPIGCGYWKDRGQTDVTRSVSIPENFIDLKVELKTITFTPTRPAFGNITFKDSTMSTLGDITLNELDYIILHRHKLDVETYFAVKSRLLIGFIVKVEITETSEIVTCAGQTFGLIPGQIYSTKEIANELGVNLENGKVESN